MIYENQSKTGYRCDQCCYDGAGDRVDHLLVFINLLYRYNFIVKILIVKILIVKKLQTFALWT